MEYIYQNPEQKVLNIRQNYHQLKKMKQKIEYNKSILGKTIWIPNGQLIINPDRIRKKFDKEILKDLINTFRNFPKYPDEFPDIIVPIINNQPIDIDGKFVVGIHNTITYAFQRARKDARDEIRAKFVEYRDINDVLLQSYKENEDRGDLPIIDKAGYMLSLKQHLGTNERIARHIGKSEEYVNKVLRIADLPEDIKQRVSVGKEKGKIPLVFAEMIHMLKDKGVALQKKFSDIIERLDPSIREARELAHEMRACKAGHEDAVIERWKKNFMAKQSLGSISEAFKRKGGISREDVKSKEKRAKKHDIGAVSDDFVHYLGEGSAGLYNVLSDFNELENAVGELEVKDIYRALNKNQKKKVKEALKNFKFSKKRLIDYFHDDFAKKIEAI